MLFDQEYSNPMNRIAILGASRGLGLEIALALNDKAELYLCSRKVGGLQGFDGHQRSTADFTKDEDQMRVLEDLQQFKPSHIYFVSGGGPYGLFQDKQWKDHQWAFQLNFLFPAKLAHFALSNWQTLGLEKMVFIGSAIAEDKADPRAASYSAAKHGLKGLVKTLKIENPDKSIHLYSPGYMDTSMLPPNAEARKQPIADVKQVAAEILKL